MRLPLAGPSLLAPPCLCGFIKNSGCWYWKSSSAVYTVVTDAWANDPQEEVRRTTGLSRGREGSKPRKLTLGQGLSGLTVLLPKTELLARKA